MRLTLPGKKASRKVALCSMGIALAALLWAPPPVAAQAAKPAFEMLLDMFQQKGVLSAAETETLRQALGRERADLKKREQALSAREQALREREERLTRAAARPKTPPAQSAPPAATAAKKPGVWPLEAVYDHGLAFRSENPDVFYLKLGGILQVDYRRFHYQNDDPGKDKFDIRRARLQVNARLYRRFALEFEYEFQGAGSRRLMDAFVDAEFLDQAVFRLGQFKVPFGLEQSSLDRNIFFAERSMGYYLTPRRDVGLMAHACLWDGRLYYGVGLFNGDGLDDASGGDQDSPALAGRLAWEPFAGRGPHWARNLHLGASFYYADIDRNNVGVKVRTTGLTPLLSLSSNAKFAVVQDADTLTRSGLELGWAGGPLAFMAEYTAMKFKNVTTSAHRFDLSMENYYLAGMWMLTGEKPGFSRGALRAITPRRSLWDGGWGALGLAMRYDHFQADEAVYDYMAEPGDSVRRADAYTVALSWFLDPTARLILDYTHTEFDRPLLVGHDSFKGTSIFSDYEDVITARFQFGF